MKAWNVAVSGLALCLVSGLVGTSTILQPIQQAKELSASPRGTELVGDNPTSLVKRLDGPYIKYGSGNAAVLIAFVSATSYGVKKTCTGPAIVAAPQVCVGALVGALVLDFLAAFLLEGRNVHHEYGYIDNPHNIQSYHSRHEIADMMAIKYNSTNYTMQYIGGYDHEDGFTIRVFQSRDGDRVRHTAHFSQDSPLRLSHQKRDSETYQTDAVMDYDWMYNNQKRFDHTDKNQGDVKSAGKSAGYDWFYNHGDQTRMCGGSLTDSGRLLDDAGEWYAGRGGGQSYPFQPGESSSEINSCSGALAKAGYSTS